MVLKLVYVSSYVSPCTVYSHSIEASGLHCFNSFINSRTIMKKFSKRILRNSFKAGLVGKQVVVVSPKYTSQIDSVSGKREGIRQGIRFYAKNGLVYDSDINAAVNIAKRSKLPVSYGNILDGQAIVIRPIVNLSW